MRLRRKFLSFAEYCELIREIEMAKATKTHRTPRQAFLLSKYDIIEILGEKIIVGKTNDFY